MNTNKDEPFADNSTEAGQAKSIVDKARAQAAKIILNANVQAKQILAQARAEGGMQDTSVAEAPKSWYYSADGQSGVYEVGKQPKGWCDSPETAKNPPKASRKKAAKK